MNNIRSINTFTASAPQDSPLETLEKSLKEPSSSMLIQQLRNYSPRSEVIDMANLNKSYHLKIKKYKGATFYGQFLNHKRHGMGIMLYSHNRVYEGEWQNDLKYGKAYEEFENGCVFQGQYINGKPQGIGRFQWPNGQFYEGEWLSGMRHGTGVWEGAKGDSYAGQWRCGKADGYGVHVWITGDQYEGQFRQNLKHGEGTQKFSSGDIYKGGFMMGKPNGYGQYFWNCGSFYKGEFKNGYREGYGVWKKETVNSDKYEGDYVRDKKQGYGIYTWQNGNTYKGNYLGDLREGYGEMYWNDSSYYKGQWRRGVEEGQGIIYSPETGQNKGRFSNNQLVQVYEDLQQLEIEPVFMKSRKRVRNVKPVEEERPRLLSKGIHGRYGNFPKKSKNILIRQKVNLNSTIIPKSNVQPPKMPTATSTQIPNANFPKTARLTLNSSNNFYQKRQVSLAKKNNSKEKQTVPHSSIRMRYLERRITTGSNHIRRHRNTSLK